MGWKKKETIYEIESIESQKVIEENQRWPVNTIFENDISNMQYKHFKTIHRCAYDLVDRNNYSVIVKNGGFQEQKHIESYLNIMSKNIEDNDVDMIANFEIVITDIFKKVYLDGSCISCVTVEIEIENSRMFLTILLEEYKNSGNAIRKKYPQCYIYDYNLFNQKMSDRYKEASNNIIQHKIYYFGGWYKTEKRLMFLHSGRKDVFADIELRFKKEEAKLFIPNYWKVSNEKNKLVILLLYSLWANLAKFYELNNINGLRTILYLSAPTGTGKTTIAKIFVKALLKEDVKSELRFDDTKASLEESIINSRDRICLVDDFYAKGTKYEDADFRSKASAITRIVGDGSVKGKMGPDRKPLPDRKYRGSVIATGEYIDLNTQSSYLRCWLLDFPSNSIFFNENLGFLQKQPYIAKSFLSGWVLYLEENQDMILKELCHWHDEALANVRVRYPKTYARFQSNVATFLVLKILFVKYCKNLDFMIDEDEDEITEAIWCEADNQIQILTGVAPEQIFKEALEEALDNAYLRIAVTEEDFKNSEYDGFYEKGTICIITAKLDKIIQQFAERKNYGIRFNTTLKKSLAEMNIIYKTESAFNSRYSKDRHVEPRRPRIYKINRRKLNYDEIK